jgi:uncharacterized protein YbjT (DUF2867 family)
VKRVIAVAGATGYVGGKLCAHLREQGEDVRALARHPQASPELEEMGCEVRRADVLEPDTLGPALEGVDVACRHNNGADNFAAAAAAAGVRRIVYLGGLGGLGEGSDHLASRHATAETLRAGDVPVTYFRAAAVIGGGSESFLTVFYLVRRLPLMVTPRWVTTRTQPIAIDDTVAFIAAASNLDRDLHREIQIGGADVTTYGGMIDELARALGRRPPLRLTVPVLTPGLSSLWIGLVTPVDAGVARPLIEGLAVETVVTDPSGMELLPEIVTTPLPEALKAAVESLESSGQAAPER